MDEEECPPPMGRGLRLVRSCGLVRERNGTGMAVMVTGDEREINARFLDAFLSRSSGKEPHSDNK